MDSPFPPGIERTMEVGTMNREMFLDFGGEDDGAAGEGRGCVGLYLEEDRVS